MSMDKPRSFSKNLLPKTCIFNAVITSVPCPDIFFLKFMAAVRRFYACIFHYISAALLPDPFFKNVSAPELIFFKKKSAPEVVFKKRFRSGSGF